MHIALANKIKVLVYGSTGVQGEPVVRKLLEQGHHVRALIHRRGNAESLVQAGAEITLGDLADRSSLEAASHSVDAIFLQLPAIIERSITVNYMHNAVDAAVAAGVKHIVFTTSGPVPSEPTDVIHLEVRREAQIYLQQSQIASVILRPVVYLENFSTPQALAMIIQQRVVGFPYAADARVSWITVEDQAALAVKALQRPDLAGSIFDLGGPEALTGNDLAARFSAALGYPVHYYPVSPDNFEQQIKLQMGEATAHDLADIFRWHLHYGTEPLMTPDMTGVLRELPVELTAVEQWATRLFKQSLV